jgi:hypothetical protein
MLPVLSRVVNQKQQPLAMPGAVLFSAPERRMGSALGAYLRKVKDAFLTKVVAYSGE